jgi:hypothetical protein
MRIIGAERGVPHAERVENVLFERPHEILCGHGVDGIGETREQEPVVVID